MHKNVHYSSYCIHPNFRGAQFPRIAISKQFAETIFADQEFRVYNSLKIRELNFRGLLKFAKIMRLENLDVYGTYGQVSYDLLQ